MSLTLPLTSNPVLKWTGETYIGNEALIVGSPKEGFTFRWFDEDSKTWKEPRDADEWRWLFEGFLADCMAKQAGAGK